MRVFDAEAAFEAGKSLGAVINDEVEILISNEGASITFIGVGLKGANHPIPDIVTRPIMTMLYGYGESVVEQGDYIMYRTYGQTVVIHKR
jgi:hypothetical protein